MKYDFDKYFNRRKNGSSKWKNMDNRKENIEDGVVPLSVADMEFMSSPKIGEKICEYASSQILGYSEPTKEYLGSVIKFFKDFHDYDAKEDWIVTTSGIVPALATSVRAFTEVGDEVIIFTPVYKPFYEVVKRQNRKVSNCPLVEKDNRYYIDYDLLKKLAARKEAKMIIICNPHNPSGRVWNEDELCKIAKIAEENELIVVSDEIHSDIVFGTNKHTVYGRVSKKAVVCTAASKTFNLAGLQCSNIFIENEEMRDKFVSANMDIGIGKANVIGMLGTQTAYNLCIDWLKEVKEVISINNNIVKEFFDSYENNFKTMVPDASFLVWVNFKNTGVSHNDFMKFLDNDVEFFTTDGKMFGDNGEYFIRINTGLPTDKLKETLERLKVKLKEKYDI